MFLVNTLTSKSLLLPLLLNVLLLLQTVRKKVARILESFMPKLFEEWKQESGPIKCSETRSKNKKWL